MYKLWQDSFEPDICEDNLSVMIEHVSQFYAEIINETLERKEKMEVDIKGGIYLILF